jgi:hypothetical protein
MEQLFTQYFENIKSKNVKMRTKYFISILFLITFLSGIFFVSSSFADTPVIRGSSQMPVGGTQPMMVTGCCSPCAWPIASSTG